MAPMSILSRLAVFLSFVLVVSCGDKIPNETPNLDENIVEDTLYSLATADKDVPYHIRKQFPYYIAGFDDENRPILVVEFGKWKLRELVEKGGADVAHFEKYVDVAFERFVKVQNLKRSENFPVEGTAVLCDLEGFNLFQFAHPPTIRMILSWVRRLQAIQHHLAYAVLINTNFIAEQLVNLARPILGSTFERFDIYGTNIKKWKPALLKKFPADQIPSWYGGSSKNYTPVAVYG